MAVYDSTLVVPGTPAETPSLYSCDEIRVAPRASGTCLTYSARLELRWVRAAEATDRDIRPGATGRVQTAAGPWLPWEIMRRTGREWSWRVGGVPATHHRVVALPEKRCRVEIAVPAWAAPYLLVCRTALQRIAGELASP